MYCPKCGSRLYPIDKEYMAVMGVCSYCVTNDKNLSAQFAKAVKRYREQKVAADKRIAAERRRIYGNRF